MKISKGKNLMIGVLTLIISLVYFQISLAATSTSGSYDFSGQSGLGAAGNTAGFDTANPTSINTIIATVLSAVLSLVGIIFFGYLIYGAYIWMTSRGNEEKVREANGTIINAIIGLIVTLGAYVLTYFLIDYFS